MLPLFQEYPVCPHFGPCAGCTEDLSLTPPPVWEEVISFLSPYQIPVLHQGPSIHWRHRAKMAVRGVSGKPLIGLFKRDSHEVHPIPDCLVHHPQLNLAFNKVRQWMIKQGLQPYQEQTGVGDIRYLQGVVQRKSRRIQLSIVLNMSDPHGEQAKRFHGFVKQLVEESPDLWHSVWLNFNDKATNTIFGPQWSLVWGEEELWEDFGETAVCYGPASFGQANLSLFEKMLEKIVQRLPDQACVAEFYAGVGVIGLFIAPYCQWVRCSEINPFAESYFNRSRLKLSLTRASKLSFTTASTKQALALLEGVTTAIADPPRKGLDACFFSALKKSSNIQQFIYISCGWESFKKDFQQLQQDGWTLDAVDGYHFFPGSNHVELLANFKRLL